MRLGVALLRACCLYASALGSRSGGSVMRWADALDVNERLVSENGVFSLHVDADGLRVTMAGDEEPLWTALVDPPDVAQFVLTEELLLLSSSGDVLWSAPTDEA